MNETAFVKSIENPLPIIQAHGDFEEDIQPTVNHAQSITAMLQSLQEQKAYTAIIKVIAHTLSHREAVYWACLCVRDTLPENPKPKDNSAIRAAEQWVVQPNEDNRYLCQKMAETAEYATAAAWAANAAFWSGGSMTPRDAPKVEPPEGVFGKAVSGAVSLAAVQGDQNKLEEYYKKFIARGLDILQGGKGDKV